jgi:anaerobic selenocysteine-containing dehydrogenase
MEEEIIKSTCRLCYNNCGVLIRMRSGKPAGIEGDPSNPVSRGVICEKGLASLEYLASPYRLKKPLKRVGSKGEGKWQEIPWDDALELVAENLSSTKQRYGTRAIQIIRGGHKGIIDAFLTRFANVLGTPNISSMASICYMPSVYASQFTYGYYAVPDLQFPPRCIVVWGCDPASSLIPVYKEIREAQNKGAKLIVVDPLKTRTAEKADLWLPLRPGTDLALALSMIHVILREKLYHEPFVTKWTTGFDELREHVQSYSPREVARLTWLSEEAIVQAARLYASNSPACIQWGNGIETNLNSIQAGRGIAILRAITGNLGVPGGEVKWDEPPLRPLGSPEFTHQDDISPEERSKWLSAKDHLAPFIHYVLPPRIIRSILDHDPYPIKAAFVLGGNILSSYPNSRETFAALMKLDFLAVSDMFMQPTAALADIVLPVASYLEFDSIEKPCHIPIASVQQKVATVGESWSDLKILNRLAQKMGLNHFWEEEETALDWILGPSGMSFQEFRKRGVLNGHPVYGHFEKEGFDTPSKRVELYSKRFESWGVDPLPIYRELPETGFSKPGISEEYPFVAISRKSRYYRHSRDRQIPSLRRRHPDPVVRLQSQAAEKLGIRDGDQVFIETSRGRIQQRAQLINDIDPRYVEIDYGWYFPEKGEMDLMHWDRSNINILTNNRPPFNPEMGSTNLRGFSCRVYRKQE